MRLVEQQAQAVSWEREDLLQPAEAPPRAEAGRAASPRRAALPERAARLRRAERAARLRRAERAARLRRAERAERLRRAEPTPPAGPRALAVAPAVAPVTVAP